MLKVNDKSIQFKVFHPGLNAKTSSAISAFNYIKDNSLITVQIERIEVPITSDQLMVIAADVEAGDIPGAERVIKGIIYG